MNTFFTNSIKQYLHDNSKPSQQDEASAHCVSNMRQYLDMVFTNRWVERVTTKRWEQKFLSEVVQRVMHSFEGCAEGSRRHKDFLPGYAGSLMGFEVPRERHPMDGGQLVLSRNWQGQEEELLKWILVDDLVLGEFNPFDIRRKDNLQPSFGDSNLIIRNAYSLPL